MAILQVVTSDCNVEQVEEIRTQIEQLIGHIDEEKEELLTGLWNGLIQDMEARSSVGEPFDYRYSVYSGLLEKEIERLNGRLNHDDSELLTELEQMCLGSIIDGEYLQEQYEVLKRQVDQKTEQLLTSLWNGMKEEMELCRKTGVTFNYDNSVYAGRLLSEIERLNGEKGRDLEVVLSELDRMIDFMGRDD